MENSTVVENSTVLENSTVEESESSYIEGIPNMYLYIGIGAIVAIFILAVIILAVCNDKSSKKVGSYTFNHNEYQTPTGRRPVMAKV